MFRKSSSSWSSNSGSRTVSPVSGKREPNRQDSRDKKFVVKSHNMYDILIKEQPDILWETRGDGKDIPCGHRKSKIRLKSINREKRRPNLGKMLKNHPLGSTLPKDACKALVTEKLREPAHKRKEFLTICQGMLRGTTFRTNFVYVSTTPYLRSAGDLVVFHKTPSLGQVRLVMHQIIRCINNFPFERLLSYYDIRYRG
jgi:hypothetical protein